MKLCSNTQYDALRRNGLRERATRRQMRLPVSHSPSRQPWFSRQPWCSCPQSESLGSLGPSDPEIPGQVLLHAIPAMPTGSRLGAGCQRLCGKRRADPCDFPPLQRDRNRPAPFSCRSGINPLPGKQSAPRPTIRSSAAERSARSALHLSRRWALPHARVPLSGNRLCRFL